MPFNLQLSIFVLKCLSDKCIKSLSTYKSWFKIYVKAKDYKSVCPLADVKRNLQLFFKIMSGEFDNSLTSPVEITSFKLQTLQLVEQLEKEVLMFFPPPSKAAATGPFRCVI